MKTPITIRIRMDYLLFDIMNDTFLRGRSLRNRENHKEVATMIANEDPENLDKLLRSIKHGFAEVMGALAEYLAENGSTTDNERIDPDTNLVLPLMMPANFNTTATPAIGEAVHDFLKNLAIAEWYMTTNKAEAADYATLAQKSLDNILFASSLRARPKRPGE